MADREYGFRTRAIHAGNIPDAATGARALPIYQSSAFVFDDTADAAARFALQKYGNIYSRLANPTVASFEERIASLEGGLGAVAKFDTLGISPYAIASFAIPAASFPYPFSYSSTRPLLSVAPFTPNMLRFLTWTLNCSTAPLLIMQ